MLLAERRKRLALADKIGHEEYIYRLNGDPSKLSMGAASRAPFSSYDGYGQGGSYGYGAGGLGGGSMFGADANAVPPIIPSLAPPESLPPVLPTVHYPKPPVYFHTKGTRNLGCSTGPRLRPLQPPLPSSTSSYVMAPSNMGISTSLPGYNALPPVRSRSSGGIPPVAAIGSPSQFYTPPPSTTNYNFHSRSGGGSAAGMSGVLNWSASPSNIGATSGAMAAPGNAFGSQLRPTYAPPAPPPGYLYDPADLPPAGKVTTRRAMPTYFNSSDMPTPSTTPRYRGSSQGLTFTTSTYTNIHR